MSEKTARTYTHVSNRAKARQGGDRKVVFKSVLDDPFRIQWPSVPINVQNRFLAVAVKLTEGVSEYRLGRGMESRKRKRAKKDAQLQGANNASKKAKKVGSGVSDEAMEVGSVTIRGEAVSSKSDVSATGTDVDVLALDHQVSHEPPSILQHLTIGINEVTRKLESQIKLSRQTVIISDKGAVSPESPRIKLIFVCRADIDPPILINHLPHLVSAYNSSRKHPDFMKLVPLPKGAEFTLAAAMGLRRVAVVAVDSTAPGLSKFDSLLESVSTLTAPWLMSIQKSVAKDLVPTHIKQVRTSAPKDLKAAREKRAKGKASAKEKNRERNKPKSVTVRAGS